MVEVYASWLPSPAGHATLATGRVLALTRAGLSPAGPDQLILTHPHILDGLCSVDGTKAAPRVASFSLRSRNSAIQAATLTWRTISRVGVTRPALRSQRSCHFPVRNCRSTQRPAEPSLP